jgi:hypothetical protein
MPIPRAPLHVINKIAIAVEAVVSDPDDQLADGWDLLEAWERIHLADDPAPSPALRPVEKAR